MDQELTFKQYRCHMRSAPGMWAQYDGYVDVWSPAEEDAFERAVRELARSSFPDRPSLSSWRLESIEPLN